MSVPKLQYHFQPPCGWMNDPNGLIYYKGKYHAFYQHNPFAPKWDTMHWGHAVSDDMMHWQHLPIALYPDQSYDLDLGCWSGSAVEKDGVLYLFYTAVSKVLGQVQCVVTSEDGLTFHKYEGNPVIDHFPADGCREFRDPKVFAWGDEWRMVLGSGLNGCGRVLLYSSADLLKWDYMGVIYESTEYTDAIECPDLFPLDGKWVLCFSKMHLPMWKTQFVVGTFDGQHFTPESWQTPEAGPCYYAPQSFEAPDGRRIQIGWSRSPFPSDETDISGALSIPREVALVNGRITMYPVAEAGQLLQPDSPLLQRTECGIRPLRCHEQYLAYVGDVRDAAVIEDGRIAEAFINGGEVTWTWWMTEE